MIFASLDCHLFDIAKKCIDILNVEFPASLRVKRYEAMKLEAMERYFDDFQYNIHFILVSIVHRYDDALDMLDELIKIDETNAAPRKRRIAIFKAKGRIPEAIKELTEYLKKLTFVLNYHFNRFQILICKFVPDLCPT